MDKYQQAAKTLNEKAPVDGPFGKERVVYINPLEEQILKNLGGSGETIIPAAGEQGNPDVPSYGFVKWFKKKFMDDILGIDDNKTFGIKHKTFIGKGLKKGRDDILGIDSKKTFGISDATLDDGLSTALAFIPGIGPVLSLGVTALDKVIENNSGDTSGRQMQREEIQQIQGEFRKLQSQAVARGDRTFKFQGQEYFSDDNDTGEGYNGSAKNAESEGWEVGKDGSTRPDLSQLSQDDVSNLRSLTAGLTARGKAGVIDPSDTAKMQALLASPGDPGYKEGFSIGGQELDPFPNRFRDAGDTINNAINDTGANLGEFIGDSKSRMEDFEPLMEKFKGMSDSAIDTAASIYDPNGVEAKYKGFQDQFKGLADKQKALNYATADSNQGLIDNVLGAGDSYANALGDSITTQADIAGGGYDEQFDYADEGNKQLINSLAGGYDDSTDYTNRSADTLGDFTKRGFNTARGFSDRGFDALGDFTRRGFEAGQDGFNKSFDTMAGYANKGFDSLRDFSDRGYDSQGDLNRQGFGALEDFANQKFDRLQEGRVTGGLASAAAERANATQQAASQNRSLNRFGNTGGTGTDMAARMIGANLGQNQASSIGDLLREGSQIEADRASALGDIGSRDLFSQGQTAFDKLSTGGRIESDRAQQVGGLLGDKFAKSGELGMASLLSQGDIASDKMFKAGDLESRSLFEQGGIDADRFDRLGRTELDRGRELGSAMSNRYFDRGDNRLAKSEALAEINPGLANVYRSQADLQNKLRALDYGDQRLGADGSNLGIDQALLDDERNLFNSNLNMRLGNTSLIDTLGSQRTRLPGMYGDAAMDPIGNLVRNVSPYTTTGALPSMQTIYNPAPYTPSSGGGKFNWLNAFNNAPQIISSARTIKDGIGSLLS